ncbi:PDR/VanB family oxidoreductase [Vibrio sp. PP-XX7]
MGDCLQISPPKNLFPMHPTAQKSLLFAAGIGITPILTMAEHLAVQQQNFELYYCARSEDEAVYLQRIRQSLPESSVHLHLTNVVGKRLVADYLLDNPDHGTHVYVCGPQLFIEGMMASARRANWPEENLHQEYFSVAGPGSNSSGTINRGNGCFEIEIHSTGLILTVPEDLSVFNVLEAHDIFIPVACEEGVCGTCLTGVLAGEVEHRDVFLTETEKQRMDQFTPCCSRARSKKLVLDL